MRKLGVFTTAVLTCFLGVGIAQAAPVTETGSGGSTGSTSTSTGGSTSTSTGGSTSTAPSLLPANPIFGTPDINYVMHNPGVVFANGALTMTVDRTLGDHLALDMGSGFRSFSAKLVVTSAAINEKTSSASMLNFGKGGTISIVTTDNEKTNELMGNITGIQLTATPLGFDYVARFKATGGDLGSKFGSKGVLFGLIYNVNASKAGLMSGFTAQSKGDVATLKNGGQVPEPATLMLLTIGLGGMVASARRRFV